MTLESLTSFLGWCTLINSFLLVLTTVMLFIARDWVSGVHSRMFGLDKTELSLAYFKYLAYFKIVVLVFNFTPYVSLKLIA